MGDQNGNEPDEDEDAGGGAAYWYCRHCKSSGHADPAPVNCPNCGQSN